MLIMIYLISRCWLERSGPQGVWLVKPCEDRWRPKKVGLTKIYGYVKNLSYWSSIFVPTQNGTTPEGAGIYIFMNDVYHVMCWLYSSIYFAGDICCPNQLTIQATSLPKGPSALPVGPTYSSRYLSKQPWVVMICGNMPWKRVRMFWENHNKSIKPLILILTSASFYSFVHSYSHIPAQIDRNCIHFKLTFTNRKFKLKGLCI